MVTGTWKILLLAAAVLPAALYGCGPGRTAYNLPRGEGEQIVAIEADNFLFKPNMISARAGDRIILQVHNASGFDHNLTLEDPQGDTLLSLDLPPDQTVSSLPLVLDEPGNYPFYCDKPFHPSLGMKGAISVR